MFVENYLLTGVIFIPVVLINQCEPFETYTSKATFAMHLEALFFFLFFLSLDTNWTSAV